MFTYVYNEYIHIYYSLSPSKQQRQQQQIHPISKYDLFAQPKALLFIRFFSFISFFMRQLRRHDRPSHIKSTSSYHIRHKYLQYYISYVMVIISNKQQIGNVYTYTYGYTHTHINMMSFIYKSLLLFLLLLLRKALTSLLLLRQYAFRLI